MYFCLDMVVLKAPKDPHHRVSRGACDVTPTLRILRLENKLSCAYLGGQWVPPVKGTWQPKPQMHALPTSCAPICNLRSDVNFFACGSTKGSTSP